MSEHTSVRLLDTCLSSIPQTETPSTSRTVFGPSRWRRDAASVADSPFLMSVKMKSDLIIYPESAHTEGLSVEEMRAQMAQ